MSGNAAGRGAYPGLFVAYPPARRNWRVATPVGFNGSDGQDAFQANDDGGVDDLTTPTLNSVDDGDFVGRFLNKVDRYGTTIVGDPNDEIGGVTVTGRRWDTSPTIAPQFETQGAVPASSIIFNGSGPEPPHEASGLVGYLVSRNLKPLSLLPLRHEFGVVMDSRTGQPVFEAHYGPDKDSLFAKLVELRGDTPTARDDRAALNDSPSGPWQTRIEEIPAPGSSVIDAYRELDRRLGTPSKPGATGYSLMPNRFLSQANSNSAASAGANNAVKSARPDGPLLAPPDGVWPSWLSTPGWNHHVNGDGNLDPNDPGDPRLPRRGWTWLR